MLSCRKDPDRDTTVKMLAPWEVEGCVHISCITVYDVPKGPGGGGGLMDKSWSYLG